MHARAGFTLIEVTIALAVAAGVALTVISGVDALSGADLRSNAIELTGAIKMNYDRSVMLKRTQRLAMNLDTGVWWIDYTEDRYALSSKRMDGEAGAEEEDLEKKAEDEDSFFDDEIDSTVKDAMEGGRAASFDKDEELEAGKPIPLRSGLCFSRVWTGHQEEPFKSGIAYLHFFPGGWTEPALIELVDRPCDAKKDLKSDDNAEYITLKVLPLSGRVRSKHERMEKPDVEDDDGRDEGDL